MIISEKQLFKLLGIAELTAREFANNDSWVESGLIKQISDLIIQIREQQSEELKVIE